MWWLPTADIGQAPARLVSGAGTRSWRLSGDAKWWYFLRRDPAGSNPGAVRTRFSLYRREFPLGPEVELRGAHLDEEVVSFQVLRDRDGRDAGLGVLLGAVDQPGLPPKRYRLVRDPAASLDDPANVVSVADDVEGIAITSPDLRYTLFAPQGGIGQPGRARLARNDGTGSCTLGAGAGFWNHGDAFLGNGGLLFWTEGYDSATFSSAGWLTDPSDCAGGMRRFADNLDSFFVDGAEGLLYSDQSDGQSATIRYARIGQGNSFPREPLVIQERAHRVFGIVGPFLGVLVALDLADETMGGIYYHPIPR